LRIKPDGQRQRSYQGQETNQGWRAHDQRKPKCSPSALGSLAMLAGMTAADDMSNFGHAPSLD